MSRPIFSPSSMPDTSTDLRLSHWLWRPSYAKLWWTAIPVWWTGMAASAHMAALESFYDSAFAGFLNILFYPLTALMVLGVGYARAWLAQFPSRAGVSPLRADETDAVVAQLEAEEERAVKAFKARTDMYDPRSGGLYIGTPTSFQHPNRRF